MTLQKKLCSSVLAALVVACAAISSSPAGTIWRDGEGYFDQSDSSDFYSSNSIISRGEAFLHGGPAWFQEALGASRFSFFGGPRSSAPSGVVVSDSSTTYASGTTADTLSPIFDVGMFQAASTVSSLGSAKLRQTSSAANGVPDNYTATGPSSWNTPGNWSTGVVAGANDTAVFNGSANSAAETVTLDANQAAFGVQLATGEGGVTFASGTGTNTLTLGTGGISANGTGTGTVTLSAGVVLNGDQTWSVNALAIGGTLSGTGNLTIVSTGNPSLSLNPTALGSVTGAAQFYDTGAGNQIGSVNGNFLNTFSNGVTIGATGGGGAYLTFSNSFTDTKNLTFANGMNVYPNGNNDVFSGSVFGGVGGSGATISYQTAGNVTFSGATDNTGLGLNTFSSTSLATNSTVLLAKASSATVHAINGNLGLGSYSTVQLGGSGGDQIKDSAVVAMDTGSVFDLNGTSETVTAISQNTGASSITNTAGGTTSTLTINSASNAYTYSGSIQNGASGTGAIGLTKNGASTTTLSGASSYTGPTNVNAGTLALTGALGSAGGGTAITVASGATLNATGSIAGSSSLTSSGVTNLSGTNSYSGATNVLAGTTTVTSASSLGSNSKVTVSGGATLAFTNPGSAVALPTAAGAWQSSSDWRGTPSNLGNGISYQVGQNGGGNPAGITGGNGAQPDFVLIDLGTNYSLSQMKVTLSNSFQTLQILTANSSNGPFTTLFNTKGHSASSPSTLNTGSFTPDSAVFGTGTSDYATGTQTFALSGVSGEYLAIYATKRVNNQYGFDLSNLQLFQLGGAITQSIGSLASSDTTSKVSLDGNVTLSTGGDNTSTSFAGTISGGGGVTKVGTGTMALTGANAYTGGTIVTAGTLLVNNTGATSGTGTGAVSVSNAGTVLGGTGRISGIVTVGSGAVLEGGSGAASGSLTLASNPVLNSGSILEFVLGASGAHSTLAILPAGFSGFNSNQAFTFLNPQAGTYDNIITGVASGIITSGWTVSDSSFSYNFVDDGNNIDLNVTPVPEPSTWAAAALAVAAIGFTQRKRFSRVFRSAKAA